MSAKVVALLVALVSGVAMAVQGSINARLGKVVGQWEAVFVVHIVGLVSVSFLLFAMKMGGGDLGRVTKGPWYGPLGGIIGVLIVWGVMSSIPKLGAAIATTSIIVGQVLTALLIDHFGLFGLRSMPLTWLKGLGLLLLAAGAKLLLG
ncbi:MAG: DMT family transporter [Firmicutes bacterium]|jgi:transporter family-2 protein|nr:DMT family transporter [Bacillota bacterium]MDH7495320.1 DMT family transporter [Bacillota bacterium]